MIKQPTNNFVTAGAWVFSFMVTLVWFLIALPELLNGSGFSIFLAFVVSGIWVLTIAPFLIKRYRSVFDLFQNNN